MRFSVLAATAAALLGASVSAHEHHHRRHHHARDYKASTSAAAAVLTTDSHKTCGCTTWYSTFYGEETCKFAPRYRLASSTNCLIFDD
jgi:hypothetical protein